MELRKYIREMVEAELDEMARISTNIKIGDPEKAAIAKELYAGTWYGDMIDYVEESGATGIPQPELARMLGKSGQQAINPKVRDFLESNIFTKGELSIPKQEKPEASGIKGRPTSEKTLMAKAIDSKMQADGNYEPTEDELTMLGAEFIERLRMRVKGTLRRGRPAMPSKAKDGMMAAMKNIGDEDTDMDGDVDDDDLDDIAESTYINESFLRMQKLAGVITESEFKQKTQMLNELFGFGKDYSKNPAVVFAQGAVDKWIAKKALTSDEGKKIITRTIEYIKQKEKEDKGLYNGKNYYEVNPPGTVDKMNDSGEVLYAELLNFAYKVKPGFNPKPSQAYDDMANDGQNTNYRAR